MRPRAEEAESSHLTDAWLRCGIEGFVSRFERAPNPSFFAGASQVARLLRAKGGGEEEGGACACAACDARRSCCMSTEGWAFSTNTYESTHTHTHTLAHTHSLIDSRTVPPAAGL
eukprot:6174660-Pleurochrysis_carterae.AAC.8